MKHLFALLLIVLAVSLFNVQTSQAIPAANDTTVLLLSSTLTGGAGSLEANACILAGFDVEIVTPAQWLTMTAADFATYRAIVLGDPTCQTGTSTITAPETTTGVWGSVIDGNVLINGTDATFHQGQGGAQFVQATMAFVLSDDPLKTKTGAWISLSCYYSGACVPTPVPVLNAVCVPGASTVIGDCVLNCYNNVHIVATHPALSGLTDATISNWSCSLHEAFSTWDSLNYQVLVIARDIASNYTAPDGSQGIPYVLARGTRVISDITLGPEIDTNQIGDNHQLIATVTDTGGVPIAGVTVNFFVLAGPCSGALGSAVTNGIGVAVKNYTCNTPGTDFIVARFTSGGVTQTSNTVRKVWVDNPLPVELTSMTSTVTNNDVTINWSTSSEINNAGFNIERKNAISEWVSVGNVAGNGTVSTPMSYSFTDRNVASGTYNYRLKQIDFNGNFEYFNLSNEVNVGTPTTFSLSQNYPNPFNPSTKIDFQLPNDGNVTLSVYDNSGKLVSTLADGFRSAGYYSVNFNAANLASGIYFYKLNYISNGQSLVKINKMSLIK